MAKQKIKITKKGVLTVVLLAVITCAASVGFMYRQIEKHEQQATIYNRAHKLENPEHVLHAYQTQAGLSFVSGTIAKIQHTVSMESDIKGQFAYIRRVREEYVTKDDDDSEWVYVGESKGHAQGPLMFGIIELPASAFVTTEYLNLTRDNLNLEGGKITSGGKYIEFSAGFFSNNYRYSYQVIEFGQTYSALIDFDGSELSNVQLYKKTVTELYEDMTRFSAIGMLLGMWLVMFALSGMAILMIRQVRARRKARRATKQ